MRKRRATSTLSCFETGPLDSFQDEGEVLSTILRQALGVREPCAMMPSREDPDVGPASPRF
jgi:hypothetical protein